MGQLYGFGMAFLILCSSSSVIILVTDLVQSGLVYSGQARYSPFRSVVGSPAQSSPFRSRPVHHSKSVFWYHQSSPFIRSVQDSPVQLRSIIPNPLYGTFPGRCGPFGTTRSNNGPVRDCVPLLACKRSIQDSPVQSITARSIIPVLFLVLPGLFHSIILVLYSLVHPIVIKKGSVWKFIGYGISRGGEGYGETIILSG